MEPLKIFVKDIKEYVKEQRVTYASGDNKRFSISLYCAPNHERYIITNWKTKEEHKFTNMGKAVRFFNELYVSD